MGIEHISDLKCLICGRRFQPDEVDYVCPDHGNEGVLDIRYNYDRIRTAISKSSLRENRDSSIWRYKPLLPVEPQAPVPQLAVGGTPLYRVPALAAKMGVRAAYVKDDGRQPTASLKDRASAIAVVKGRERKAPVITTASTGNAAAALSGLCAVMGQKNVIFVPETAPPAKIAQLLTFGSTVMLVKGNYDRAFELCMLAAAEYGWYNRNTGFNPYMTEGKKTVAYEICEQLNWEVPDRVFVSVGDGCIIGGIHKGFKDLQALGWIERIPRLMGVQAAGSSYLYQAWKNGEDILTKSAIAAETIADSISAGLPRDRIKALAAVRETDGAFMAVSDAEILDGITALAREAGVFSEPAGAASYAGLVRARDEGMLGSDETVVVINTGNGLKDIGAAMAAAKRSGPQPYSVEPEIEPLKRIVAQWR